MTRTAAAIVQLPAPPKETHSVRLPAHVWDDLTRIGSATKRSRSNLIELALDDFIRKNRDVVALVEAG